MGLLQAPHLSRFILENESHELAFRLRCGDSIRGASDILTWKPCERLVLPPLVRQHAVDPIGVLGKLLLQVLAKRLRTMDRHSILMIDFERHRTGRVRGAKPFAGPFKPGLDGFLNIRPTHRPLGRLVTSGGCGFAGCCWFRWAIVRWMKDLREQISKGFARLSRHLSRGLQDCGCRRQGGSHPWERKIHPIARFCDGFP